MSDDDAVMRDVLHEDSELKVALVIGDGELRLELESTPQGPDLSEPHEVVVVVDGEGREVDVEGERKATAVLRSELEDKPPAMMLMVRVFEFFEGWELFADDD